MISFTSDFECGNGKLIDYEEKPGEIITFVAESKLGEPAPMWFYFRVEGLKGADTEFVIANAHQFLADFQEIDFTRDCPVYRPFKKEDGGSENEWKRCGPCRIEEHKNNPPPRVSFIIPSCPECVEIAFCYPYPPSLAEKRIGNLKTYKKTVIGYSTRSRQIIQYSMGDVSKELPLIYISCRQHAGEVAASWVLDGLMEFLSNAAHLPFALRIVPFVDIDGVTIGAYGKDQKEGDMNRAWTPIRQNRAEIDALVRNMRTLAGQAGTLLVMDLHSPAHDVSGILNNIYTFGNEEQKKIVNDLLSLLNGLLEKEGMETIPVNPGIAGDPGSSQGSTGMQSQFVLEQMQSPRLLFEISYHSLRSGKTLTINDYRSYGTMIGRALITYFLK
ncbi:succinylglutamate desuccinylase/aspartoacylase family protein [Treponema sp. OttesenSCG-928-L16]|nr:succinylglutamate desuccinylase/aspartoacylase family protein [Treponema sp. OttesenSCG-928-L16]